MKKQIITIAALATMNSAVALADGKILLYKADGTYIDTANVGNLPDSIAFSAKGNTIVSANEGEPSDDYTNDPQGSISIINLNNNYTVNKVTTLGFDTINIPLGVRIKPGASVANDLEPEYVTISKDDSKAWVSLQENNAMAIVNLDRNRIDSVVDLGRVDLSTRRIDISDDGLANPTNAPKGLFALYQPDTLATYQALGKDYVVSANEGDDREYSAWEDYEKLKKLKNQLPEKFKSLLNSKSKKLRVLKDMGLENDQYQSLYLAGTRSFSIRDEYGNLVFDSGSEFEDYLAENMSKRFNTRVDDTNDKDDIRELKDENIAFEMIGDTAYFWEGVDARSLKKGVEPEALALADINGRTFAYIGLEKQGGFFVYDVSSPASSEMIEYVNDIEYNSLPSKSGDLAPEGMVTFVQDSKHYLAIANELSSTVSIYRLANVTGKATKITSLKVGGFDQGAAEILDYWNGQLFVTNGETKTIDVINIEDTSKPFVSSKIDFSKHGSKLQSVSVNQAGIVAISIK